MVVGVHFISILVYKQIQTFRVHIKFITFIAIIAKIFDDLITVVSIMAGGMLLGFLLRAKQRIVSGNEKLITYAIYLLLFMMGVSIGSNEQIMNSLSTLGIVALIVSMGAIIGSILTGFWCLNCFLKTIKVERSLTILSFSRWG